jgi:hypothetical protein
MAIVVYVPVSQPTRSAMSVRSLAFLLVMATPAAAHDWYPRECCSGFDCAPAERVQLMDNASFLVKSMHGTTVVPGTFPKRESKDNRMHVCMRPGEAGRMKPICVFVPPAS